MTRWFSIFFLSKSLFLPPSPLFENSQLKLLQLQVHSKRRNRLHQKKMNGLVFVMYNLKMKERRAKSLSTKEEIGLENLSSDDEWLAADSVDLEDDSVDFDEDNEGINL